MANVKSPSLLVDVGGGTARRVHCDALDGDVERVQHEVVLPDADRVRTGANGTFGGCVAAGVEPPLPGPPATGFASW